MAKCAITGCSLYCLDREEWAVTDLCLWEEGECWIFNATQNARGETRWMQEPVTWYDKKVVIKHGVDYFERRGVIVVNKDGCILNEAAEEYLRGS